MTDDELRLSLCLIADRLKRLRRDIVDDVSPTVRAFRLGEYLRLVDLEQAEAMAALDRARKEIK